MVVILHTGVPFLPNPQSQNRDPLRIQGSAVGGGSCVGDSRKGTPGLGGEASTLSRLLVSMVSPDLV